jgi:hypothetical protein
MAPATDRQVFRAVVAEVAAPDDRFHEGGRHLHQANKRMDLNL